MAALSGITSGSTGQELFTDETRGYTFFEDAYAGFITGNTDEKGNRLAFNFSAGPPALHAGQCLPHQPIPPPMATTAPRSRPMRAGPPICWRSAQVFYNDTRLEAFYLDPDELPVLDTKTALAGVNLESRPIDGLMLAASYVTAVEVGLLVFQPQGTVIGTRDGLNVFDARFTYMPNPPSQPGPFFGAEAALQTHRDFDMFATAGYGEIGYSFADTAWAPAHQLPARLLLGR